MSRPEESPPDVIPGPTGGDASPVAKASVPPIDCDTAVRRLWDYLDGGLTTPDHAEVEAHLATCAECPSHFAFAVTTLDTLAGSGPAALTPEEMAALRARIRTALSTAALR